jgi:hypothetical protein
MKKQVIATVLGAVGLAVTSYGQGTVYWSTYAAANYYPIVYGATAGNGLANTGAGANVDAELLYSIGAGAFAPVQDGLGGTTTAIQAVSGTLSQSANGIGSNISGWIAGPIVTIPGYSSGPVNFEILAWVASGTGAGNGTYAGSGYTGSITWTETAIQGPGLPAKDFQTGMPGDVILNPVPEPTTLALAGLGGLASLIALRRKQS